MYFRMLFATILNTTLAYCAITGISLQDNTIKSVRIFAVYIMYNITEQ